jgi:hypothetical protein
MMEGMKEGRKEGSKEGRKEGGRKEGRRKEGGREGERERRKKERLTFVLCNHEFTMSVNGVLGFLIFFETGSCYKAWNLRSSCLSLPNAEITELTPRAVRTVKLMRK